MTPLAQPLFDIFALARPRGHGFGYEPPIKAWQSAMLSTMLWTEVID